MWRSTTQKTKSIDFTPYRRKGGRSATPGSTYAFHACNVGRWQEDVFCPDTAVVPHTHHRYIMEDNRHVEDVVMVSQLHGVFCAKDDVSPLLQTVDDLLSCGICSFPQYTYRLFDYVIAVVHFAPAVSAVSDCPFPETHLAEAVSVTADDASVHWQHAANIVKVNSIQSSIYY